MVGSGRSRRRNLHEQVCGGEDQRSVCEKQDVPFGWGVVGIKDEKVS